MKFFEEWESNKRLSAHIDLQNEEIKRLKSRVQHLESRSAGPSFGEVSKTFPADFLMNDAKERVVRDMKNMLSREAFDALRMIMETTRPEDGKPTMQAALRVDDMTTLVRVTIPEMHREVHIIQRGRW